MLFEAHTQKGLLLFLLVINSALLFVIDSAGMMYLQFLLITFILMGLFIRFKLKIAKGLLSFEILIFKMKIFKRDIYTNQIASLHFKRTGWSTKCVVVQTTKGLNLRIVNFYPETIFEDLIDFADEHNIAVIKTKDYLILEKQG
ncbi:hypothetical protein [Jeotgalibacillus proteolyticus]|uniref:Uncharacterized protein n=1 Tax=Jeotgalibacillus proteolyticus TaxID=2082395 RepID=A0A2S5G9D8_9BACL|nr:hypothetical protein [Jeotgalibacillus proteolyticus]PPA69610.1 hypothetical protein C4B60_13765 [Jeotgalibacillus proteolyticus]